MYYVYILFSPSANIFYTGSTNNLERRISQHNAGYSKSTKRGIPWKLCYFEEYCDRSSAMKREAEIKSKKSHVYIQRLISTGERPE